MHKPRRAVEFSDRVPARPMADPYYGDAHGFEEVLGRPGPRLSYGDQRRVNAPLTAHTVAKLPGNIG